jgi:hypothetical protein
MAGLYSGSSIHPQTPEPTMNTLSRFSTLLILGLTLPAAAYAQQSGDWVRVETSQTSNFLQGRLLRADADSIVLLRGQSQTDTVAVPQTGVKMLWVSGGEKRNTLRGMGYGFLAGATLGGVIGAITFEPCVSDVFLGCLMAPEDAGEAAALGGIVGGFAGFVVGTIVGVSTKRRSWVPMGAPVSVGVAPAGNGRVALSGKVRF